MVVVCTVGLLAACGNDESTAPTTVAGRVTETTSTEVTTMATPDSIEQRYPDVLDVEATRDDDGTWSFAVTMSSPYDTPERYADGWRVLGPDGAVYGEHMLMHDHAAEQPFTRTQDGVEIPPGVSEVTIEGRDQRYGFGGTTVTITLAG